MIHNKITKLTIALPGLFWSETTDIEDLYAKLKLTNFTKIFKHTKMSILEGSYSELVYGLHTKHSNDYAKQIATELNLTSNYSGFLIAEPINLQLDRDHLQILESNSFQLDQQHCNTIIEHINSHFVNEIKLHYISNSLWLLCHNLDINLNTHQFYPTIDIRGENINDYLPRGKNIIWLNKLINEIQMLLYNMPLNQQRINDGLLPINSLWLWNKRMQLSSDYAAIYTNSLTTGFNHAKIKPIPIIINTNLLDNSLIIIDDLYSPCCDRDGFSWIEKLQELDNTLGLPLTQMLYNNEIEQLDILIPQRENIIQLSTRPSYKYKFWQNKKLINLVKEAHAY
ncbi:MAG: hypothetical protein KBD37_06480 [Burkholderiales bacterium]|nr:hypothetical protein [Burkholderiales bacterium]